MINIKSITSNLLFKICVAIILGILLGNMLPEWLLRIFVTYNSIFSSFLTFSIPLIILTLIVPSIADLGSKAKSLLLITVGIAYTSTVLSGSFSLFVSKALYPSLLANVDLGSVNEINIAPILPVFNIQIPVLMDIMTALVLAFILGLGLTFVKSDYTKTVFSELRDVINMLIQNVIIPLLPLYIFGIFLIISYEGKVSSTMDVYIKIIMIVFVMHIVLLLAQYFIAYLVTKKNPFKALATMLPAYFTALGTQSSAATIPVTLERAKKNGVRDEIADFCVPLCATIHLSGSILKIVACAYAISYLNGMPIDIGTYLPFIFLLGITMVAAPGVPGGAIMAAVGLLTTNLHFDPAQTGLMIALYITMDSFGTAANVTGDGAIALIVNSFKKLK